MSKIALSPNASGTATFTLAAPGTNTDRTLTLPDNSGTVVTTSSTASVSQAMLASGVAGTGPAFSAYQSTQQSALSANTFTKLLFQTKEFDTNTCFDTSTSRFTPTVAGYYQVNAAWTAAAAYAYGQIVVYKNGALVKYGSANGLGGTSNIWVVSALVYLNGSTDYIESYAYSSVSQSPVAEDTRTYFQAFLARSA